VSATPSKHLSVGSIISSLSYGISSRFINSHIDLPASLILLRNHAPNLLTALDRTDGRASHRAVGWIIWRHCWPGFWGRWMGWDRLLEIRIWAHWIRIARIVRIAGWHRKQTSGYPYKAQSSFKLNVSLLESEDCRNVIAWVWSLVPTPVWEISWISWWEAAILRTAKFLQGWGRIVARLEKGTESQVHNCLQVAQQSLKVDHVNELC
jgi:hypothetical protein